MNKSILQVWIMCPSKTDKMRFLLFQQNDPTEKKEYWGPWEREVPDAILDTNEIPFLLQDKNRISLIDPILIPFRKNYEKEDPAKAFREIYLVYGMKIASEQHLLFDHETRLPESAQWIPLVQVLDYLHKEYHSIIFFDWVKAIKLNKLP